MRESGIYLQQSHPKNETFSHPAVIQFRFQFKSACLTIKMKKGLLKESEKSNFHFIEKERTIDIV